MTGIFDNKFFLILLLIALIIVLVMVNKIPTVKDLTEVIDVSPMIMSATQTIG
jgi:hypothetical protein